MRRPGFIRTLAMLALAVTAGISALSAAPNIHADVPGPVVIGDQVFAGGTIELSTVGTGQLVAIAIDGRRIGLAFRESLGATGSWSRVSLVLREDGRGLTHLVGVSRSGGDAAPGRSSRPLRIASVTSGLLTVPPYQPGFPRDETLAAR